MNVQLKEVIWEVTSLCDKNCEYCGSKDFLNSRHEPTQEQRLQIAKQLASYGVHAVNLSGGEPGMLTNDELQEIICTLKNGCKYVSVITNGKALCLGNDVKIGSDDWKRHVNSIGVSINCEEDFLNIDAWNLNQIGCTKVMVTNFGTHNIWQFEKLMKFAQAHFDVWQVQLTVGKYALPKDGIQHVYDLFRTFQCTHDRENFQVVYADNLRKQFDCTAGVRTCGICYDGHVVACLSERSSQDHPWYYGNVFERNIKDIWENEFRDIRFEGACRSCRKCFNYPERVEKKEHYPMGPWWPTPTPKYPISPIEIDPPDFGVREVMMYACFIKENEIYKHFNTGDNTNGIND